MKIKNKNVQLAHAFLSKCFHEAELFVVMGNRFEITIDYRFTIGKTKPIYLSIVQLVNSLFRTTSLIMVKYNQLQYLLQKKEKQHGICRSIFISVYLYFILILKLFGKILLLIC